MRFAAGLCLSALAIGCSDPAEPPSIHIAEQSALASAYFDSQGMLHIACETDIDCLAAQGYFHASERFFQMDLGRRFARGQLSEIGGAVVLGFDQDALTYFTTREGRPIAEVLWEQSDERTQQAILAYTRGVNSFLEDARAGRNGAKLSAEYDYELLDQEAPLRDWEPLDSVATFLPLMDSLTNSAQFDLRAGVGVAALGPLVAKDVYGTHAVSTSTILSTESALQAPPFGLPPQTLEALQTARKAMQAARDKLAPGLAAGAKFGSNSWVLGPQRGGGKSRIANDPHLALTNPALWYLVHLDAKTEGSGELHIAGASLPGLPGVLFGQNETLAWGVTTAYFDQSDVYLETLNAEGTAVIFKGEEVPIVNIERTVQVSGQETPATSTSQYVPHHGPILSIDASAGTATSLRWTGQDADTDLNFLWAMWVAEDVAQGREALRSVTSVGQNFVLTDTETNIGWYPYNRVPTRPWISVTPSWLPLPGDGSAEWGPFVDYADLPQATNPSEGYIATANNDMTGDLADGDPGNDGQLAVQAYSAEGFRHERIAALIEQEQTLSAADMQEIQHDTKSLYGEKIVPILLSDLASVSAQLSEGGAQIAATLQGWDYFCPTGFDNSDPRAPIASIDPAVVASARGCAAFHAMWPRIRRLTLRDELSAAETDPRVPNIFAALAFINPAALSQTYWDDVSTTEVVETREQIVAVAAERTATFLQIRLGEDPDEWRWGALHALTLSATLFDQVGVLDFNHGPFMNDGGLATVNVSPPRDDRRDQYGNSFGASIRLTCEADSAGLACDYELPGGQPHHRDDPLYQALIDKWLTHQSVPLGFSIDEARESAVRSVLVRPSSSTGDGCRVVAGRQSRGHAALLMGLLLLFARRRTDPRSR